MTDHGGSAGDGETPEAALRHEVFERVFRMSPVAMGITVIPEGRILDCNDALLEIAGRSRAEVIGKTTRELEFWGDPTHHERLIPALAETGATRDFSSKIRRPTGELRDVILSTEIIEIRGQSCTLGVLLDVTERNRLAASLQHTEAQVRQLQKMEAVGALAGGIAHDFNNILSVILSHASFIEDGLVTGDPMLDDARAIREAAERAANLTHQLLAFSRRQVLEPRIVRLDHVIGTMATMLRRTLGSGVTLTTTAAANLGSVRVDPGQFEQVLLNLAVNARDAMPDGGELAIETDDVELTTDDPRRGGVAPGPYVRVRITDTGTGMDGETRERAFEPFFTTKPKGKGTGLGLSTAFGIIAQSAGTMRVDSAPGKGTTFELFLPRTEDTARALATQLPPPDARPTGETILLVEDEEPVRKVVHTILRREGYVVLTAANAGEALLLCELKPKIDLLLTDIVMPIMNGRQLAERLVALYPALRVLYMSGYHDDALLHEELAAGSSAFLHKPVRPLDLVRKVREAFEARQRRP